MAHISYRANLSAAIFPLSYDNVGGTVIVPQGDQNYDRRVDPTGEQKTAGIPQAIFLENVIPTEYGYQSVGYKDLPSIPLATGQFISFAYQSWNGFVAAQIATGTVSPTAVTWALNKKPFETAWQSAHNGPADLWFTLDYDTAFVRGQSYAFAGTSLYKVYEGGALLWEHWLDPVTSTNLADMYWKALIASHNYLICVDRFKGAVQWSSTTDPTNFMPSLVSGAGSVIPNDFRSPLVALRNTAEGFIMFCEKNAISATYTGNARYPWKFKEIPGSFGFATNEDISAAKGTDAHYAIDAQRTVRAITSDAAQAIAPEISTWLRGKPFLESWNDALQEVQLTIPANSTWITQLRHVMHRYLFLSYTYTEMVLPPPISPPPEGAPGGHWLPTPTPTVTASLSPDFTHVLVYDLLLQRYGRLKVQHRHLWEHAGEVYFMSRNGQVKKLVFDLQEDVPHNATLILGKFQYVRSRHMDLHGVRLEHARGGQFTTKVLSSLDGVTKSGIEQLVPTSSTQGLTEYDCRLTGMNHQLVIQGKFDINTVALTFSPGAGR